MTAPTKAGLEDVRRLHVGNRLIRPRSEYTGPTGATYIPPDDR